MHSSSRIVTPDEVVSFEPFALDSLSSEDTHHGAAANPAHGDPAETPPRDDGAGHHEIPSRVDLAYRDGFQDGFRDGEAQALAQCEARDQALGTTLQERVDVLMRSLDAEFQGFQSRHADRVVDLAVAMARQIVRHRIDTDRESILPLVQEVIEQLREVPGPATLLLDPLDAVLVGERLAPLLQQRQISVAPDPAIAPGGCRLVSIDAEVDATLATRWERLLAAMGRGNDAPGASAEPDAPADHEIGVA